MSNNDEEVDLFDLSAGVKPPMPLNGLGGDERPFETETNVFSIEFDKTTGPKIVTPPAPRPSAFDDTDIDDDMPKPSFFEKLFGKKKAADDFDADFDDIPVKKRKGKKGFDDDFDDFDLDIGLNKKAETPAPAEDVFDLSASIPAAPAPVGDVFELNAPIPAAPAPAPVPKASAPIPAPPPAPVPAPPVPPPEKTPPPTPTTPPPVFGRIAHVCLFVRDLEASVNYYSALGMKNRFAFNKKGRVYGAYMEFGEGGNFIELFEDPIQAISPNGRLAHFCLQTPDIDATIASLSARGIKFTPKKFGCDATYQIWLKDPDGNDFEIHQYTPKSSQLIGGDVEADW